MTVGLTGADEMNRAFQEKKVFGLTFLFKADAVRLSV
jgi:hypothetical protein